MAFRSSFAVNSVSPSLSFIRQKRSESVSVGDGPTAVFVQADRVVQPVGTRRLPSIHSAAIGFVVLSSSLLPFPDEHYGQVDDGGRPIATSAAVAALIQPALLLAPSTTWPRSTSLTGVPRSLRHSSRALTSIDTTMCVLFDLHRFLSVIVQYGLTLQESTCLELNCLFKIEEHGFHLYWLSEGRDAQVLDLVQVWEARPAGLPKDGRVLFELEQRGPRETLEDRTVWITHGQDMVVVNSFYIVAQDVDTARVSLARNLLRFC